MKALVLANARLLLRAQALKAVWWLLMGRSSALEHGHLPDCTQHGLFLQQQGTALGTA